MPVDPGTRNFIYATAFFTSLFFALGMLLPIALVIRWFLHGYSTECRADPGGCGHPNEATRLTHFLEALARPSLLQRMLTASAGSRLLTKVSARRSLNLAAIL